MSFSPLYIFGAIALGIAIDWAYFENISNVILQFYPNENEYIWKKTLKPRIIFTITSSLLILYGLSYDKNYLLVVTGTFVFNVSSIFAIGKIYFSKKL